MKLMFCSCLKEILLRKAKNAKPSIKKSSCFGASAGAILESVKMLSKPRIKIIVGISQYFMSTSIQQSCSYMEQLCASVFLNKSVETNWKYALN